MQYMYKSDGDIDVINAKKNRQKKTVQRPNKLVSEPHQYHEILERFECVLRCLLRSSFGVDNTRNISVGGVLLRSVRSAEHTCMQQVPPITIHRSVTKSGKYETPESGLLKHWKLLDGYQHKSTQPTRRDT